MLMQFTQCRGRIYKNREKSVLLQPQRKLPTMLAKELMYLFLIALLVGPLIDEELQS